MRVDQAVREARERERPEPLHVSDQDYQIDIRLFQRFADRTIE
jgi:hypothetical protein